MNDNTIDSLRDALTHSPDNTPLRFLLADTLLSLNRLDEAETEYSTLIKIANDTKAKVGLATVFFKKGNYSACNVILEDVIDRSTNEISVFTLHAKALLKEHALATISIGAYDKAVIEIINQQGIKTDVVNIPKGLKQFSITLPMENKTVGLYFYNFVVDGKIIAKGKIVKQ